MFKGLRFSEPLKRVTLNVSDQVVNCAQYFLVRPAPIKIILFGPWGPKYLHRLALGSINSISESSPRFASSIESRRRAALAGLLSKWTVSISPSYSSSEIITTLLAFWRVTRRGDRLSQTLSIQFFKSALNSV